MVSHLVLLSPLLSRTCMFVISMYEWGHLCGRPGRLQLRLRWRLDRTHLLRRWLSELHTQDKGTGPWRLSATTFNLITATHRLRSIQQRKCNYSGHNNISKHQWSPYSPALSSRTWICVEGESLPKSKAGLIMYVVKSAKSTEQNGGSVVKWNPIKSLGFLSKTGGFLL